MIVRKPVVAGTFYPLDKYDIDSYLNSVMIDVKHKKSPKAIIVPHAGYIFSASVAASAYSLLESFDTYIILGPNHTGLGKEISVFNGVYDMPFGKVNADEEICSLIVEHSSAEFDEYAHIQEHSIEVQLPFIDYISKNKYSIVPVVVATGNRKKLTSLANAIYNAVKLSDKKILIVVSSDMNHYEDQKTTLQKDDMAIREILNLDEESLLDTVLENDISMCGIAPAYCAIKAAKLLNASKGELIEHKTSGEVNGDYSQVVGYASILIE